MSTTTADTIFSQTAAIDLSGSADTGFAWIKKIGFALSHAWSVSAERRALSRLSDDQLCDIGLTGRDVTRESKRSVFDLPSRNGR